MALHTKKSCSHRRSHRHGKRRRKCAECGATWSLWKRRRGRKPRPSRLAKLSRTFLCGLTIRQQAKLSGIDEERTRARLRRIIGSIPERPWPVAPPRGQLILLLDGLWFRIKGKKWVVYLTALRSVRGRTAVFIKPFVRQENESLAGWMRTLEAIPMTARKRIRALVSDGLRGLSTLAKHSGWTCQRCHFHLLGRIANVFGTRKKTVAWIEGRRHAEVCIREFITTASEQRVQRLEKELVELMHEPGCPRKVRMIIREVLRRKNEFRAYLDHPELRLPATSNVMESMNRNLRDLAGRSRGFRTGASLERWITTYLYFHPKGKCMPKIPQN